jgi:hypothetical protein
MVIRALVAIAQCLSGLHLNLLDCHHPNWEYLIPRASAAAAELH